MKTDDIKEVGIDELDRLYIIPETEKFEFIYRYAAEVNWNESKKQLYTPKPTQEMPYINWFKQILIATKYEYGIELKLTQKTIWNNIEDSLQKQIMS